MDPLLIFLHGILFIGSVRGQADLVQAALNAYCNEYPNSPGCSKPGSQPSQPGAGCGTESRICPQRPNFCVPKSVDCSELDSGTNCVIPQDFGLQYQILLCGDGKPEGIRCGTQNNVVPALTQLLLQCQGPYLSHISPVSQLGSLSSPAGDGGAGVYRCGTSGSWEPLFGSPVINQLTATCTKSGCGRVPQPSIEDNLAIHRKWAWVRALYYRNKIQCTATLLSPTAALTAAHCLTRSLVSRVTHDPFDFAIELPGPTDNFKRITFNIKSLHIHPRYNPQRARQHDTAVVKFDAGEMHIPTMCLSDAPRIPSGRAQLVFALNNAPDINGEPKWTAAEARRDATCLTVGTRTGVGCSDRLVVLPFQFCAEHPEVTMIRGSSGGPFLVEVGTGVEEVWELAGVLSHLSNSTSCQQTHSIYNHVAEDTEWIRRCVFDGRCN